MPSPTRPASSAPRSHTAAKRVGSAPADPRTELEAMSGEVCQRLPSPGLSFGTQGRGAAAERGQRVAVHGGAAGQTVGAGVIRQIAEQAGDRPLPRQFQHGRVADLVEHVGDRFRRQDLADPDAGMIVPK